jgi:hypothetical protein
MIKTNKRKSRKKKISSKKLGKTYPKKQVKNKTIVLTLTDEDKELLILHKSLKLQIELVPSSCWFSNTRKNLKRSEWDRIRLKVYAKANNICEICGGQGTNHPVDCHEVWIYDDENLVQRLGHFESVCPFCHEVKHFGLAQVLGNEERAFNRFKTINNLNQELAYKLLRTVIKQWNIRSKQSWGLDIEHLKKYGFNIDELKNRILSKPQSFFKLRSKTGK